MKYIYGPVESRRLGFSLGLSLSAYKVCNFDCIYCQLGGTKVKTLSRKELASKKEVLNELKSWLKENAKVAKKLDYVTISGLGEPTLSLNIKDMIKEAKESSGAKVAVITNASLLNDPKVRAALLEADLIVPSLDAVIPLIFRLIDRPGQKIKIEEIVSGLKELRKEFKGKIWLEVMIVKGVNDSLAHISKLKEVIAGLKPDKVQINSPVRATAEKDVLPAAKQRLLEIKRILGSKCEIL